jgi:hypothetical protein
VDIDISLLQARDQRPGDDIARCIGRIEHHFTDEVTVAISTPT